MYIQDIPQHKLYIIYLKCMFIKGIVRGSLFCVSMCLMLADMINMLCFGLCMLSSFRCSRRPRLVTPLSHWDKNWDIFHWLCDSPEHNQYNHCQMAHHKPHNFNHTMHRLHYEPIAPKDTLLDICPLEVPKVVNKAHIHLLHKQDIHFVCKVYKREIHFHWRCSGNLLCHIVGCMFDCSDVDRNSPHT